MSNACMNSETVMKDDTRSTNRDEIRYKAQQQTMKPVTLVYAFDAAGGGSHATLGRSTSLARLYASERDNSSDALK